MDPEPALMEGWYLMSTEVLERILIDLRAGRAPDLSRVTALTVAEALAFKRAGNVPDAEGRSLRLVLHAEPGEDLSARRLSFEPDLHEAPAWRSEGSVPVNVVPLRTKGPERPGRPWWEDPDIARLETEWQRSGAVAGLRIPGDYRSFVFKTVVALQGAGEPVTVESVAASIARWLPPSESEEIAAALRSANA